MRHFKITVFVAVMVSMPVRTQDALSAFADALSDVAWYAEYADVFSLTPELCDLHKKNRERLYRNRGKAPASQEEYVTVSLQHSMSRQHAQLKRAVLNKVSEINKIGRSKRTEQDRYYNLLDSGPASFHFELLRCAVPINGHARTEQQFDPLKREMRDEVKKIVEHYKQELKGITFVFNEQGPVLSLFQEGSMRTLGVPYQCKTQQDKKRFITVYAHIVDELLQKYPHAWLVYGYKPHVHVPVAEAYQSTHITDLERMYWSERNQPRILPFSVLSQPEDTIKINVRSVAFKRTPAGNLYRIGTSVGADICGDA